MGTITTPRADLANVLASVMEPKPGDVLGRQFVTQLGTTGYTLNAIITETANGRPYINLFSLAPAGAIPLDTDPHNIAISIEVAKPHVIRAIIVAVAHEYI